MRQGSFRRDLYYRLNVIPLHIPALRERREDILPLAEAFCGQFGSRFIMSAQVQAALVQYKWPGNIRELKNCMEYLHYMGRRVIELEDLPEQFRGAAQMAERSEPDPPLDWAVLRVLGERYPARRGIGRQGIVSACGELGVPISEHEVRLILRSFQDAGWLAVGRGRGGTSLTGDGYAWYRRRLAEQEP